MTNAFRDTLRGAVNGVLKMADNLTPRADRPSFVSYVNEVIESQRQSGQNLLTSYVTGNNESRPEAQNCEECDEVCSAMRCNATGCHLILFFTACYQPWETLDIGSRTPSYDAINEAADNHMSMRSFINPNRSYDFHGRSLPRKSTSSYHDTSGHVLELREREKIMAKPVEGAIRYGLATRRCSGNIGKLILTNMRLNFTNYHKVSESEVH